MATDAARLERALVQGRPVGVPTAQAQPRLADQVSASYGLMGRGPQQFLLSGSPAAGVEPAVLEAALRIGHPAAARLTDTTAQTAAPTIRWPDDD